MGIKAIPSGMDMGQTPLLPADAERGPHQTAVVVDRSRWTAIGLGWRLLDIFVCVFAVLYGCVFVVFTPFLVFLSDAGLNSIQEAWLEILMAIFFVGAISAAVVTIVTLCRMPTTMSPLKRLVASLLPLLIHFGVTLCWMFGIGWLVNGAFK